MMCRVISGSAQRGFRMDQHVGGAGYIDLAEIAIVKPQYGETELQF